jgi:hypothetical protein
MLYICITSFYFRLIRALWKVFFLRTYTVCNKEVVTYSFSSFFVLTSCTSFLLFRFPDEQYWSSSFTNHSNFFRIYKWPKIILPKKMFPRDTSTFSILCSCFRKPLLTFQIEGLGFFWEATIFGRPAFSGKIVNPSLLKVSLKQLLSSPSANSDTHTKYKRA